MTTKQIKEAFEKLSSVFYSKNQNFAEVLMDECAGEERGHRGFMDGFRRCHTSDTIGVKDAARLFAVKRVAEYLLSREYPCGEQYLHMQRSCFTAAAIADEFAKEIRAVWTPGQIEELSKLDYGDFVKVKGLAKDQGYQPKTGEPCDCVPGQERDNCPQCEGTGQRIDFKAIRARH